MIEKTPTEECRACRQAGISTMRIPCLHVGVHFGTQPMKINYIRIIITIVLWGFLLGSLLMEQDMHTIYATQL